MQHMGLRLALGALRTSPIESLYFEANEAPLSLRREKLALQYFTKLRSCPSNPAFDCTINPKYQELFARKESSIPTFGIRIKSVLENSGISNENVHQTIIPEVPFWTLHQPKVNLEVSNLSQKGTSSLFLFRNLIKLSMSTLTVFQFILMGQKTMTGLDVERF